METKERFGPVWQDKETVRDCLRIWQTLRFLEVSESSFVDLIGG
jgi:hypothetical protein